MAKLHYKFSGVGKRKTAIARRDILRKVNEHLKDGNPVRTLDLDDNEQAVLRELQLLTAKPVM